MRSLFDKLLRQNFRSGRCPGFRINEYKMKGTTNHVKL